MSNNQITMALAFDGQDDFIEIKEPFKNNTEFTISLWLKPSVLNAGWRGFLGKEGDSTAYRKPSMWLAPEKNGLHYDSVSPAGYSDRYNGILENFFEAPNQWVHIAWVKQGKEYRFYRNGELFATKPAPEIFYSDNHSNYWIGRVDNFFPGEMTDVRIWSRARSQAEIQADLRHRLTDTSSGSTLKNTFVKCLVQPVIQSSTPTPGVSPIDPTKIYTLTASHSGRVASLRKDTAIVEQRNWMEEPQQQWRIEPLTGNDSGHFRIVSVHSGNVMEIEGINDRAAIVARPWNGSQTQQWKIEWAGMTTVRIVSRASGKVLDVSSGSQEQGAPLIQCPWIVNSWKQVPGSLKWVSVGADGTVWGVNENDDIFRRTGDTWTQIPGKLKQISVGNADNVWGVNSNDYIYRRTGDTWTNIPGKLKNVSVGADGTVWGVNSADYIYRRTGDTWTNIPGRLKNISVGSASFVWGVNSNDDIFRFNDNTWIQVPGKLKQVSVSADGIVWGTTSLDDIYRRDGNDWNQVSGKLKQISAGSEILIWGVNSINNIYHGYGEMNQQWQLSTLVDPTTADAFDVRATIDERSNSGLVGYWPLLQQSGTTVNDYSPSANHGTLYGTRWIESELPLLNHLGAAGSPVLAPQWVTTPFAIAPKFGAAASRIKTIKMIEGWAIGTIQVQYENLATSPPEVYDSPAYGSHGGSACEFSLEDGDYLKSVFGEWGAQAPNYPREEIISLQFQTQQGKQSRRFGGGGPRQVESFNFVAPEGYEIVGFWGATGSYMNNLVRLGVYLRPIARDFQVADLPSQPNINLLNATKIKLKSWKGDYLNRPDSAQNVTTISTNSNSTGNEWTVETIADRKIKLKSCKGDYLRRCDRGRGVDTGTNTTATEWIVEDLTANKIKLKSWTGDYLHRSDSVQEVTTWYTGIGNEWEVEFMTTVLQLDGQTNYIEIPHSSVFEMTNNFTVEAWFSAQTLEGYRRIFSKFPGFGSGLVGNALLFTIYWVKDYVINAQITAGTWYHVAVVFDASNSASFYLNGDLVQTVTGETPATVSTGPLEIGRKGEGRGEYFHGQLAELRIWNKARTQAEIQASKSYRLFGNEPNLVAYWPLDEATGSTIQDKTSNANHGSIRGAVLWSSAPLDLGAAELNTAAKLLQEQAAATSAANPPAETSVAVKTAPTPVIIELEPQTPEALEEFFTRDDGPIYDTVDTALDQMRIQGLMPRKATPVFIVISSFGDAPDELTIPS